MNPRFGRENLRIEDKAEEMDMAVKENVEPKIFQEIRDIERPNL